MWPGDLLLLGPRFLIFQGELFWCTLGDDFFNGAQAVGRARSLKGGERVRESAQLFFLSSESVQGLSGKRIFLKSI